MSLRYLLLLVAVSHCLIGTGQNWQQAQWQTIEGKLDSAEVKLPSRALTGNVYLKVDKVLPEKPLNTEDLAWLVSAGDTVFVRRYYRAGTSSLYQLVVAGTYDLYRTLGSKGRSAWQLRTPDELIRIDPEEYLSQMAALVNGNCPALEKNANGMKNDYQLILAAENLNVCAGDQTLEYSALGQSFGWRLNFTLNTPLNLINQSVSTGSYWGLRIGAERPARKIYNGLFFTGGIQPYYYHQDSDLQLGTLQGIYSQEWEMSAVQFNLGSKIEVWPSKRFTPFGEFGLGMVVPVFHRRYAVLQEGEPQSPGYPVQASMDGGMGTSFGVYWAYGLRMKYKNDWLISLQLIRDGMFVDIDYGELSSGSRSLFFNQDNTLLIGEWRRWELLLQKQF